jgi:hypothetical protein
VTKTPWFLLQPDSSSSQFILEHPIILNLENGCQVNYAAHHASDYEGHASDHKVLTYMDMALYHVRKALNQIN